MSAKEIVINLQRLIFFQSPCDLKVVKESRLRLYPSQTIVEQKDFETGNNRRTHNLDHSLLVSVAHAGYFKIFLVLAGTAIYSGHKRDN